MSMRLEKPMKIATEFGHHGFGLVDRIVLASEIIYLFGSHPRGEAPVDNGEHDLLVAVPDETPPKTIGLTRTTR